MKNFWWAKHKFWLGLACSAIFLFLAFRNVQWVELGAVLQSLDWSYLLVATVLYVLHLVVRGQRWQALLAPLGHLTVRDAFAYVNIGYMANNLLPLRAGEVIRAVLLGEKKGISKSAVLATVVVERLLDILSLAALTVIVMFAMPIPPLLKQTAVAFGGVSCLAAAGLWWAAGHPFTADTQRSESSPESERGRYLVGSKPTGLLQKVLRLCRSFVGGLAALRSPGHREHPALGDGLVRRNRRQLGRVWVPSSQPPP